MITRKQAGLAVLGVMLSASLYAQDARTMAERCVQVIGGPAAVERYFSFEGTGRAISTSSGWEVAGDFTMLRQGRKLLLSIDLEINNSIYARTDGYDGEVAFKERWGTIAEQPTLGFESDLDHTIALLTQQDASFSLAGETEVGGRKVVTLEVEKDGKRTTFHIDAQDHTVAEILFEDLYYTKDKTKELMEKRIRYSDYTDIEGVLFPKHMVFFEPGQKLELTFERVDFTAEIPRDRFHRPQDKLDTRYYEEKMH